MSDDAHLGFERDPTLPKGWGQARTRSRRLPSTEPIGGINTRNLFGTPTVTKAFWPSSGVERTIDATHWAWKYGHRTPFAEWDFGGPFDSRKVWIEAQQGSFKRVQNGRVTEEYSGHLFAHNDVLHLLQNMKSPAQPDIPFPYRGDMTGASNAELMAKGATAIARTLPTAPSVNIAQTLGEIKEGLPSLTGRALGRGDVGGEYLNFQFGIVPTSSDVQAYREAARKSGEVLAQWRRDSGRRVRRRYTFDDDGSTTTTVTNLGNLAGATGGFPYAAINPGSVTTTKTTTRRWWFSGAYRYFIPETVEGLERKFQDLTRQYGYPTPDVLWELTPFSWLLDWETNIGDVMANLSQLGHDDLVLTYGYIMCHSRVVYDYVWQGHVYNGTSTMPFNTNTRVIVDVKQRAGASPYGLGMTITELSPRQIAILAALGLSSKSKR